MKRLLAAWVENVVERQAEQRAERSAEEERTDNLANRRDDRRELRDEHAQRKHATRRGAVRRTTKQARHQQTEARDRHRRTAERDVFLTKQAADQALRVRAETEVRRDVQGQVGADAAVGQAVASYLEGQVALAESGAIPGGARAASQSIVGPPLAKVDALLAAVQRALVDDDSNTNDARGSVAWALGAGLMPHPADVTTLLVATGGASELTDKVAGTAEALGAMDTVRANPQLEAKRANERLDLFDDYCKLLEQVGVVGTLLTPAVPTASRRAPEPIAPMPAAPGEEFHDMLDSLFC